MLFTNDTTHREYESPILIRRDELGIRMVDLCRECGTTPGSIYDLAYGVTWPVYIRDWSVKPWVSKLLEVLDISIEDAFPLVFCKMREYKFPSEELFIGQWSMDKSDEWEQKDDSMYLHDILSNCKWLTVKERQVLHYRYVLDETLAEIGVRYGVQQERIRQIECKALRKMRHPTCRYTKFELFEYQQGWRDL